MSMHHDIIRSFAGVLLIGSLATAADLSVAELEPHLGSLRPTERLAALTLLAQIRDAAALKAAIAAARQPTQWTQSEIAVLADILAAQDFSALVALLADPDNDLVDAAILDLGRRPPELLKPVIKDLLGGQERHVKIAQRILAVALRQSGTTPAHAALALIQFQDANESRSQAAVRSLTSQERLDRGMVDYIAKHPAASVRVVLVEVIKTHLTRTGQSDPADIRWMRGTLQSLAADASDAVRSVALAGLDSCWSVRPSGDSDASEQALFLTAMSDASSTVRQTAIRHFAQAPIPEAIPHIERLAGNAEGTVAATALEAARRLKLATLGTLAFQASSHPHPQSRRIALAILIQLSDPRLVPVATRLLDDPDYDVRTTAQRSLAVGSIGVEAGVLALAKAANLKSGERQSLLVRLAQQDPPARLAEVTKLYEGMDGEQRRQLMANCVRDIRLAASIEEFLLARTADPDPVIAVAAFNALSEMNDRSGRLGLPEAMERRNDRDPKVAAAAERLLVVALRSRQESSGENYRWLLPDLYANQRPYDPDNLPPVPETPSEIGLFIATAGAAPLADKQRYFTVMAGIDDPRALAALQEAARSAERATRWAALDALVRRGDQSDATLDHALARMLTAKPDELEARVIWPAMTPRLLERLGTFTGVADAAAVMRVRAEIERRLAAVAAQGAVR